VHLPYEESGQYLGRIPGSHYGVHWNKDSNLVRGRRCTWNSKKLEAMTLVMNLAFGIPYRTLDLSRLGETLLTG